MGDALAGRVADREGAHGPAEAVRAGAEAQGTDTEGDAGSEGRVGGVDGRDGRVGQADGRPKAQLRRLTMRRFMLLLVAMALFGVSVNGQSVRCRCVPGTVSGGVRRQYPRPVVGLAPCAVSP